MRVGEREALHVAGPAEGRGGQRGRRAGQAPGDGRAGDVGVQLLAEPARQRLELLLVRLQLLLLLLAWKLTNATCQELMLNFAFYWSKYLSLITSWIKKSRTYKY